MSSGFLRDAQLDVMWRLHSDFLEPRAKGCCDLKVLGGENPFRYQKKKKKKILAWFSTRSILQLQKNNQAKSAKRNFVRLISRSELSRIRKSTYKAVQNMLENRFLLRSFSTIVEKNEFETYIKV